MAKNLLQNRRLRDFDFLIVLALLGISIMCTITVYATTINRNNLADLYKTEIIWQCLSYVALIGFTILDYRTLKRQVAWIGYGFTLLLLLVVFVFPARNGAHSWIILPGFQFQPSEFAKIFIILTIADFMEKAKEKEETFGFKHLAVIGAIVCVPFALILAQPALGQALVLIGIVGAMMILFLEKKQLTVFIIGIAVLFVGIFTVKAFLPDQSIKAIDSLPMMEHQKQRIITFIDPEADPKGTGYQVTQANIAVGAGRLTGEGILKGTQTAGAWVPEQWTDFIFSALAEEMGFVGASILLFLFFFILYRMILVASDTSDFFASSLIAGVVGMFAFQIVENVGMNLSIMPVAGITLPFVSYGGSSLLTNFSLVGIVLSVAVRRKKLTF
ncbi:rod shape-determining protein RodA [Aneurinibacillus terranovensis]|uniref:rod shape-determining protein RodA n=1 Tax=Aneurinibacillus terranovensis TaxID=278991 RepID=UPI0004021AAF|nr:rod shape-determining protein RodA [Aneurinibacillus terranovensis]